MNPFPTDAKIKAETIIGIAQILTRPPENFIACENKHEEGNSSSTRRLQFTNTHDDLQSSVNTVKTQQFSPAESTTGNSHFSQPIIRKQTNMPQHLQERFL